MSRGSVAGRAVLVTGASRGIGAATARALAARGAHVSLVGLEPDRLQALAAELGSGHTWFEADVTDQAAVDAAVAGTVERLGRLDAVVANAGVVNYGSIRIADPSAFARTVEVNLIAVYRTIWSAVPHLIRTRGYALVVASMASFVPLPGAASYAASKAGAESLALTLGMELARDGVAVGSVHPSWVDTDMTRDAERALPSFRTLRASLPWPARATTSVEACAEALADGVARRARRVYVPGPAGIIPWVRPLLASRAAAYVARRRLAALGPSLDAEALARR